MKYAWFKYSIAMSYYNVNVTFLRNQKLVVIKNTFS